MNKIVVFIGILLFFLANVSFANYNGYKAYLKGLSALKNGKLETAITEFERTLAYDTEATTVYKDLALTYLQQGNRKKSLDAAKKLQELEKNNIKTQLFLASFYVSVNDLLLAKKCWEKVLELDPNNEVATVYLASYYYSDNKLKESIDYWTKFLEQKPESAEGYFQLGLAQEKLGLLDEALKSYKKVNEINSETKEGFLARARIYESKKEFKLAIKEYKEYTKLFSAKPEILLYLGKCYFEEKKYLEAEQIILKAKENFVDNVMLYYLLGLIYEKQGKIDEAIEMFEYVVNIESTASNYARLGYYYALKQEYKYAEQQFNKALEIEPLNPEILYLSGLNYIDYKKYDKAKKVLEKALLYRPYFIDAKFYLALSFDKLGYFEKAEKLLKEIIEFEPNNVKSLNYLAYSYIDKDINLDEAEKMLNKVIKLQPKVSAYIDSLGWLYYKKQNYELAEKYTLMAVNNVPRVFDKDIYEHLGDISIKLKKFSQAYLSYAIACDIGSKTAINKIKLLEKIKIEQNEKFKIYAQRAVLNFHRIASLKAGYKLKIKNNSTNINSYISVLFARDIGLQFDFAPKFSFKGGTVTIKDNKAFFEPRALKENIAEEFLPIFDFTKQIISKDFLNTLLNSNISQKGDIVTYENNNYVVRINIKKGFFSEFSKKNLFTIKVNSYKKFNTISKIPSKILVTAKNYNFKCEAILNNSQIITPIDFNKISGQSRDDIKGSSKNQFVFRNFK